MALTLDIPVRTSITLPDNWQDCQTPQQLSYWLIARFDELAKTSNINELKEMVTELRAYVDTYDARIDELVNVDASLGEDITALEQSISTLRATLATLENFLSDIDNTLTNLVRDVEGNTSDITAVDRRVDLVHEGNITNAQKISVLESSVAVQNGKITTLDQALTNVNRTVSAQAEKFAGLTEAVTFNVTDNGQRIDIIDKDVRVYNIVCSANVVRFDINFEFSEMPVDFSEYKFYITSPDKALMTPDVDVNIFVNSVYSGISTPGCGEFAGVCFATAMELVNSSEAGTPFDPSQVNISWLGGDVLTVVFTTDENNSPKLYCYGNYINL